MALSEGTQALLAQMVENHTKPFHQLTVPDARAFMDGIMQLSGPGPKMSKVEDVSLGVAGGSILLRVLTPTDNPDAVIVYFHGGGWVLGSAASYEALASQLAAAANAIVVVADYRLAPENPFPVPVNDAYAAVEWASTRFALPLVVMGDSSGGNIAAVVAQRASAILGPAIGAQVLIYPVTDFDPERSSFKDPANQLILRAEDMIWFWDHYVPSASDRVAPTASPLRALDLSKLPPACVITAEYDILRDEGEAYAKKLTDAGVAVDHKRFAGETHGFFGLGSVLPSSGDAMKYIVDFLARTL